MDTTTELTRDEFTEQIQTALFANRGTLEGETIDIGTAWDAYTADPGRWHKATEDNPHGHVGRAFILTDGGWWINEDTPAARRLQAIAAVASCIYEARLTPEDLDEAIAKAGRWSQGDFKPDAR